MSEEEIIEIFDSKEQAENSSFYHTKTLYSYIGPDWYSSFDFEKITSGKVIIHISRGETSQIEQPTFECVFLIF